MKHVIYIVGYILILGQLIGYFSQNQDLFFVLFIYGIQWSDMFIPQARKTTKKPYNLKKLKIKIKIKKIEHTGSESNRHV